MILIFAPFSRCGTTSLQASFRHSCNINTIGEPFNCRQREGKYGVRTIRKGRGDINDLEKKTNKKVTQSFNESFSKIKDNGFSLIKHIAWSLDTDDNKALLCECDKVIFIYRKHMVDQYISQWMSQSFHAGHSNVSGYGTVWQWNKRSSSHEKNLFYTTQRDPININLMKKICERKQREGEYYASLLRPENSILLEYSTFYNEAVEENFRKLVSFLGLVITSDEWKTFLGPKNKFNDQNICRKLIPNYEEVISYRNKFVLEL